MSAALTIRIATEADLGALRDLMALSIDRGQAEVLTPAQIDDRERRTPRLG